MERTPQLARGPGCGGGVPTQLEWRARNHTQCNEEIGISEEIVRREGKRRGEVTRRQDLRLEISVLIAW